MKQTYRRFCAVLDPKNIYPCANALHRRLFRDFRPARPDIGALHAAGRTWNTGAHHRAVRRFPRQRSNPWHTGRFAWMQRCRTFRSLAAADGSCAGSCAACFRAALYTLCFHIGGHPLRKRFPAVHAARSCMPDAVCLCSGFYCLSGHTPFYHLTDQRSVKVSALERNAPSSPWRSVEVLIRSRRSCSYCASSIGSDTVDFVQSDR